MKKKRQWFMCLGMIGVFTASVILSVFGQRKVKAQLNTENAGKITSSWADEKHIFSSFDDEKALSVDASYGFKMHATDQTKTIIEAGKKAAKLPEIEMPDFLKKYTWFQTSQNTAGNIKIRKTNMEIYQCKADGSNGHWEKLDLVMTVTGIEKYKNQDGYVAIGSGINGCAYVGIEEMTLKSDFYKVSREKQYKNVKQLLICEEYLEDDSGELRDYKFFCFDGKFKFVQVDSGRFSEHIQNFYDNKWNKLDFTYVCEKNDIIDIKPEKYEEMITLAEKLSSQFPFVRVDFYYINNKIYFGELTFTPNNGMESIKPIERDMEIAGWIDIKKYKFVKFVKRKAKAFLVPWLMASNNPKGYEA